MNVDQVWAWLEPAIARGGGETTFEQIAADIMAGRKQLWVQPNGAAVTYLWDFPSGLRVLHVELAGGDLGELLGREGEVAAYARENGAKKVTMHGRKGWARTLKGWRETGVTMERDV